MIQQSTKAAVVVFHSARKQELAKKLARLWTKWLQLRLHSNVVSLLLNIKSLRVNIEHSHGLQQLYYTLRNKSELYCLHWLYGAGSSIRAAVCLLHTFVFIRGWVIFIFEFTLIIIFLLLSEIRPAIVYGAYCGWHWRLAACGAIGLQPARSTIRALRALNFWN